MRTIEIVGLDLQADGGTHVANTREVGAIRVTGYESKGRINKRIRLELAQDDHDQLIPIPKSAFASQWRGSSRRPGDANAATSDRSRVARPAPRRPGTWRGFRAARF